MNCGVQPLRITSIGAREAGRPGQSGDNKYVTCDIFHVSFYRLIRSCTLPGSEKLFGLPAMQPHTVRRQARDSLITTDSTLPDEYPEDFDLLREQRQASPTRSA